MKGQGGSYIRQPDGSLKLASRTEPAAPATGPAEARDAATETKPIASRAKKEPNNG